MHWTLVIVLAALALVTVWTVLGWLRGCDATFAAKMYGKPVLWSRLVATFRGSSTVLVMRLGAVIAAGIEIVSETTSTAVDVATAPAVQDAINAGIQKSGLAQYGWVALIVFAVLGEMARLRSLKAGG